MDLSHLDTLSMSEVAELRQNFKSATFITRNETAMVDGAPTPAARAAAATLDALTSYMQRRFPRRGSTPPCAGVVG